MTKSVWKNTPDGKTVRRNKIAGQWTWWTIEMMESPAYRALNLSEHRVIARIRIELARHGGRDNGKLPVTFQDFNKYGVRWDFIAPAIRAAEALGFIRVTRHGRPGTSEFRVASLYALTHLPTGDDQVAATNAWNKIGTMEEATDIAEAARLAAPQWRQFPKRRRVIRLPGLRQWTVPTLTEIAYTGSLRELYCSLEA